MDIIAVTQVDFWSITDPNVIKSKMILADWINLNKHPNRAQASLILIVMFGFYGPVILLKSLWAGQSTYPPPPPPPHTPFFFFFFFFLQD